MANCGDGRHQWNFGEVANQEFHEMEELFDFEEWMDEDNRYLYEVLEDRLRDSYDDGVVKFSWTCNKCHRKVFSIVPIRIIMSYSTDENRTRKTTRRNSQY